MPTFRCNEHNKVMIEKVENKKIIPYCSSCLVEKEFNEVHQRYLENKEHNEREFKKSKRKYFLSHIYYDIAFFMWISLFIINLFTGLMFWKASIWISIGGTIIFLLVRAKQGEYTIGQNSYSEPTIESIEEQLKDKVISDAVEVVKFKTELEKEYHAKSVEMEKIDLMDGFEFEEYIGQLLSNLGYQNVKVTQKSGDGGVDIIAKDPSGNKIAVQCKRLSSKVGNSAIQEVYLGKKLHNCNRAMVITNSYFTKPAIEAAEKTQVELWDRDKLIAKMRKVEVKVTWENFLRQYYKEPVLSKNHSFRNVLAKRTYPY